MVAALISLSSVPMSIGAAYATIKLKTDSNASAIEAFKDEYASKESIDTIKAMIKGLADKLDAKIDALNDRIDYLIDKKR